MNSIDWSQICKLVQFESLTQLDALNWLPVDLQTCAVRNSTQLGAFNWLAADLQTCAIQKSD